MLRIRTTSLVMGSIGVYHEVIDKSKKCRNDHEFGMLRLALDIHTKEQEKLMQYGRRIGNIVFVSGEFDGVPKPTYY